MKACNYHWRRSVQERRAAALAHDEQIRGIHLALADAHAALAGDDDLLILDAGVGETAWGTIGHALRATPLPMTRLTTR